MTSILQDLEWRGAINQQTNAAGLEKLLNDKHIALYCGVDPTGDSMHVGHLIPFMVLRRFQLAGHQPVMLIGGATGSIGDPSGRTSERQLQSMETVQQNVNKLTAQLKKLFAVSQDGCPDVKFVNNYDWTHQLSLLDFLRDFGKHFNITTMLSKDIVSSRLDTGISFTEFSYQILQAMDYLHLFEHENVQLQIGGSDQWGNIVSGLELIRKKKGHEVEAYGLTIPLMLKSDGTKFGKSAGNAIWLDPEKTTPYEFYQFWLNQDDRDVIKYIKYFTFLSVEEIETLAKAVETEPHKRQAQKRLAAEVTTFVHGPQALEDALKISQALFSGDVANLSAREIEQGFKNMPTFTSDLTEQNFAEWLVDIGIEKSRRQSREDITNGAISLNGEKITDVNFTITREHSFEEKFIIVRRGKKNYFLVKLV